MKQERKTEGVELMTISVGGKRGEVNKNLGGASVKQQSRAKNGGKRKLAGKVPRTADKTKKTGRRGKSREEKMNGGQNGHG